jgi:hypothetical protein
LEKDSAPIKQQRVIVQRIEYRANDRLEKTIATQAFV